MSEHFKATVLENKWLPNKPHPTQAKFLLLSCREALYGGAAGGGKSEALLMAALQYVDVPGYSAIIFRRSYTDLALPGALMDRAQEWLGGTEARFSNLNHVWSFPSSATLAFGNLEHEQDKFRYQSAEFQCVEQGTLVLMADGAYKAIEQLQKSDKVATLEGPKRILQNFGSRVTECVEAIVYDSQGKKIGKQVHPKEHKILTPTGWFSYADVSHLSETSSTTQFHEFDKSSLYFGHSYQFVEQQVSYHTSGKPQHALTQLQQDHLRHVESDASSKDSQNDSAKSDDALRETSQPLMLFCSVVLHKLSLHLEGKHSSGCVPLDVQNEKATVKDSQSSCLTYSHHNDELSPFQTDNDQDVVPSLDDVEEHNHVYCKQDVLEDTRLCNQTHLTSYVHPYTKENRFSSEAVQHGSCFMTPIGKRVVYDIAVEHVNHYITISKLVNKNCIAFDELTQFMESQYRYLFSRLRRRSDSPIPLRMRGASNPGNIGHDWVKQRFMTEGSEHGRVFIPAKLEDNPSLDRERYIESLSELDPITRRQYLDGDWTARHGGSMFLREWFKIVREAPAELKKVRFWDKASTEPKPGNRDPDWTVGLLLGTKGGQYWVLDVKRARKPPPIIEQLVSQTGTLDNTGEQTPTYMEQEPGSSGVDVINYYARTVLPGLEFHAVKTSGPKTERAAPVSSAAEAGNIFLVQATWNTEFLDEIEAFPDGLHDDQVDALSGAFSKVRGPIEVSRGKPPW